MGIRAFHSLTIIFGSGLTNRNCNRNLYKCAASSLIAFRLDKDIVIRCGIDRNGSRYGVRFGGWKLQFRIGEQFVRVNVPTRAGLKDEIIRRLKEREGFALATINLDHLVKMSASPRFLRTYQAQDFVVADGRPIVWLSKIARRPVSLMPGSDMVHPLCRWAAEANAPVALVGSTQSALEDAERALQEKIPGINIAWIHAPGILDPESDDAKWILQTLQQKGVGLCFLAFGAPKQERLAQLGREIAPNVGFASVGAGLDFLGGHQRRAPVWVRNMAMEWLWRALSSPMRLGPRYLQCIRILPSQLLDAVRLRLRAPHLYSKMPRR